MFLLGFRWPGTKILTSSSDSAAASRDRIEILSSKWNLRSNPKFLEAIINHERVRGYSIETANYEITRWIASSSSGAIRISHETGFRHVSSTRRVVEHAPVIRPKR